MSIAEVIRSNQDIKEMTRRAIKILESAGENVDDLKAEFFNLYLEEYSTSSAKSVCNEGRKDERNVY